MRADQKERIARGSNRDLIWNGICVREHMLSM